MSNGPGRPDVPDGLDGEREGDVATRTRKKVVRPPRYQVLLYNDDYTPMEFVVSILEQIFGKGPSEATQIMLQIHRSGLGVGGVEGGATGAMLADLAGAKGLVGFTDEELAAMVANVPPGGAALVMMLEHLWFLELEDVVALTGGEVLAHGFVDPEVLVAAGVELAATVEAAAAVEEAAAAVETAAVADTVAATAVTAAAVQEGAAAAAVEEAADAVDVRFRHDNAAALAQVEFAEGTEIGKKSNPGILKDIQHS